MNKTRFISFTASLVLAITFTLSCEDKETKDKPAAAEAPAAAAVPETVAAVSENSGKTMYVNDKKGLNMRSEPSTDGAKLGTLPYGEKVQVLEKSSTPMKIGDITDYWYKTDANSWVFGGFLSEKPPKDRIRVIDKTCFIIIVPERDKDYVDETGDWAYYTGTAREQFEKIGIETIYVDAGEKKRYLSFVLDDGESYVVDTKNNFDKLLYKKGKKPIDIAIDTPPIGGNLESISKYLGVKPIELMKKAEETGGSFSDNRDGYYNFVLIGEQIWMAENLNFPAPGSKCYGNDENNCYRYGRYYDWATAKKACPAGWHLPSDDEWTKLENAVSGLISGAETAGTRLKSSEGWNSKDGVPAGTDQYRFSALPGGNGYGDSFENAGESGYWWTATEQSNNANYAWYRKMSHDDESVNRNSYEKAPLFSVRCVMD
jgi:uncharacterized protein (TIGR02145 family)